MNIVTINYDNCYNCLYYSIDKPNIKPINKPIKISILFLEGYFWFWEKDIIIYLFFYFKYSSIVFINI